MANTQETLIGSARMDEEVKKPLLFVLKDNSVDTKHLKKGCITKDLIASSFMEELAEEVREQAVKQISNSFIKDCFGDSATVTISQKLLTDTVNSLYDQIREINGDPSVGFYMTVNPSYFIGEKGEDIHIEAVSTSSVFEKIALYADDVLIAGSEDLNVYRKECDTHIDDTTVIKCVATILGVEYTVKKTVSKYTSFWMGAGNAYEDIMNIEHLVPIGSAFRGSYEVTCQEGEHIIIVLGDTLKRDFIRADLNGFEIPFTTTKVKVDDNDYWALLSDNIYRAGTYLINING